MARKWSDEDKAGALAMLAEEEQTLVTVHHATGIPTSTLHDWALKAGLGLSGTEQTRAALESRRVRLAAKKEALAEELLDLARDLYHQAAALPKAREAQALATAAAIMHDKHRLEMGEHTQATRLENHGAAETARQKLDELSERRQAKTA